MFAHIAERKCVASCEVMFPAQSMIQQLEQFRVEKPWGVGNLPAPFADPNRIGEIWFQNGKQGQESHICDRLLVKYLFTSEKLSVQVHPDDVTAKAKGLVSGKSECWYILNADPGATLGLGLKEACEPEALRKAALSGEIEHMLGDIWFVPPGTIHALGGGLSLIEIQQNVDITYRLYDYGRSRELHLDDAMSVAKPAPYDMKNYIGAGDTPHLHSSFFSMHLVSNAADFSANYAAELIAIPLETGIAINDSQLVPGQVYYISPDQVPIWQRSAKMLIAWPNSDECSK